MVFCHVECLNIFYFNIHLWTISYGFDLVWMRKVEYEDGICQKTAKLAIKAMFSDFYGLSWQLERKGHQHDCWRRAHVTVIRTLYTIVTSSKGSDLLLQLLPLTFRNLGALFNNSGLFSENSVIFIEDYKPLFMVLFKDWMKLIGQLFYVFGVNLLLQSRTWNWVYISYYPS